VPFGSAVVVEGAEGDGAAVLLFYLQAEVGHAGRREGIVGEGRQCQAGAAATLIVEAAVVVDQAAGAVVAGVLLQGSCRDRASPTG